MRIIHLIPPPHPPFCVIPNQTAVSESIRFDLDASGSAVFKKSKLVGCAKSFKLLSAFVVKQSQIALGGTVALGWDVFFGCNKATVAA